MKKILIILGMFLISFTIAGCTQEGETVTEPTFNSFTIDGQSAVDGSNLVTFYKGKNEVVEVEVSINNPSNLLITSIKINGDSTGYGIKKTGVVSGKITEFVDLGVLLALTVKKLEVLS